MRGSTDPSELEQRLRQSGGKTARAQITATKPGKVLKTDDPAYGGIPQVVWKVTFRIYPDDRGPFTTVAKLPYPQKGGGPPVGSEGGVLYDPRDPTKLVIDRSAATQSWGSVQAATTERNVAAASNECGMDIARGQVITPQP